MTDAELRMGIYAHWKGPLYQVLGLARDANDRDRRCVVYIGLQLDHAQPGPRLIVRNYQVGDDPFVGLVEDPSSPTRALLDGSLVRARRRFTYLGPELTADMMRARPSNQATTEDPR